MAAVIHTDKITLTLHKELKFGYKNSINEEHLFLFNDFSIIIFNNFLGLFPYVLTIEY